MQPIRNTPHNGKNILSQTPGLQLNLHRSHKIIFSRWTMIIIRIIVAFSMIIPHMETISVIAAAQTTNVNLAQKSTIDMW